MAVEDGPAVEMQVESTAAAPAPLDVRALLAASVESKAAAGRPSVAVDKEDVLSYDLGHLSAFDPSPIDEVAFKASGEEYLLQQARDNVQLLANKLYELLKEQPQKSVIMLPKPLSILPREKPLPKPRPLTRWEKFAQEKGIVKKKRSKMVWDEQMQQWAPRYGYGRANNPNDREKDWLVEVKPGDDPNVDPFETKAEARRERLNKQKRQEERNRLEAAHAAGLTSRGAGAGMGKVSGLSSASDRKSYLNQAIAATQLSTASVGRFDKRLEHEPSKGRGKRQQYASATDQQHLKADKERATSVVSRMFPEGAMAKSAAISADKAEKVARLAEESSNRQKKLAKNAAKTKKVAPSKAAPSKAAKPSLGAKASAKGGRKPGAGVKKGKPKTSIKRGKK